MSRIDAKPCLIIQFVHCLAHISHQSGAGSHGNIAAWQVTPVLFQARWIKWTLSAFSAAAQQQEQFSIP